MNTSAPRAKLWDQIKRGGWLSIVVFFVLGASSLIAQENFGKGYGVATAAVGVVIWLGLRPWRFGLLSPQERREICWTGGIGICGFLLRELLRYWKW